MLSLYSTPTPGPCGSRGHRAERGTARGWWPRFRHPHGHCHAAKPRCPLAWDAQGWAGSQLVPPSAAALGCETSVQGPTGLEGRTAKRLGQPPRPQAPPGHPAPSHRCCIPNPTAPAGWGPIGSPDTPACPQTPREGLALRARWARGWSWGRSPSPWPRAPRELITSWGPLAEKSPSQIPSGRRCRWCVGNGDGAGAVAGWGLPSTRGCPKAPWPVPSVPPSPKRPSVPAGLDHGLPRLLGTGPPASRGHSLGLMLLGGSATPPASSHSAPQRWGRWNRRC